MNDFFQDSLFHSVHRMDLYKQKLKSMENEKFKTNHLEQHQEVDDNHLNSHLNYENLINTIDDQLDIIEDPI